ncbi:hypothetical protein, partial [Paenibacillus gallinarum]
MARKNRKLSNFGIFDSKLNTDNEQQNVSVSENTNNEQINDSEKLNSKNEQQNVSVSENTNNEQVNDSEKLNS